MSELDTSVTYRRLRQYARPYWGLIAIGILAMALEATASGATLWLLDGEAAAYSYVSATGLIGPLAGRDQRSAAGALRAELARHPGRMVTVAIPGTCTQLVEVALALRRSRPTRSVVGSRREIVTHTSADPR